ncbi:hypothetical protein NDU88_006229 [Pleurodeles waltl]|uniref:Uncharacterized protein n=1 Tax=Pleurodeles waltl TaxID=8319 RepID=A0AAV7VLE5_PLEWA|nr:hypothetical protein NDU88_006229 [Pleurodeles waltl]
MALVGRPRFSGRLPRWTGLSLMSSRGPAAHLPQGPRPHQQPRICAALLAGLLTNLPKTREHRILSHPTESSSPCGGGPHPRQGPASATGPNLGSSGPPPPWAQSPTRLTSGRQWPAPLLRSLARHPHVRGPEHRTRLQQPQAPATAQLPVPRGHPESRRLRSSPVSGPDPLQGTFRCRISSNFSASGPAAPKDQQGVS